MKRILFLGMIAMTILATESVTAQTAVETSEIIERVREVVGWSNWQNSRKVVLLKGTAEYLGIPADYEFTVAHDGKCFEAISAHGIHGGGFDGERVWTRIFSHPPRELDLSDEALQRVLFAIRTHSWLSESSPYQVTRVDSKDTDREVCVQLTSDEDRLATEIAIDRSTWLPVRATRSGMFGPVAWEFGNYGRHDGVVWPRDLMVRDRNEKSLFQVTEISTVPDSESVGYSMQQIPSNVHWNTAVPSRVEVRRAPSGHWFVKPLINGLEVGWFAVDTGTGAGKCVSPNVADRIGLNAFGKTFSGGAGDRANPARFRPAETFELGPATLQKPTLMEMPQEFADAMTKMFGFEWGGTVGCDFLSQVVAEFDLSNVTLDLHNPEKFDRDSADWQALRFNQGIPCVHCKFENDREGWFYLDTGAGNVAIVHSPAVESMRLLDNRKTTAYPLQGVGSSIDAQMGELKEFRTGNRILGSVTTFFVTGRSGALSDPFVTGTFGAGILGGGKVIFDYQKRRLALMGKQ